MDAIRKLMDSTVVRALFVSNDAVRRAQWVMNAAESISLNAATASTVPEVLAHLSEEAVDVIVVGPQLDDGSRDDLLAELSVRHPHLPAIAIGVDDPRDTLEVLDRGAFEALRADESSRLASSMLRAIRDAELGRALRLAQHELQSVLATSDRHAFLLGNAPALIWSTDEALTLRAVDGADALRGAIGTALVDWDVTASESDRSRVMDVHRRALAGATTTIRTGWHGSQRIITVASIRESGRIVGTVGTALAIVSDGEAAGSDPVRGPGAYDAVTDLPNRALFEQRVAEALRAAQATGERVGVLFVDIDRFKSVNDQGGHGAGDAVLRALARRLHKTIGEQDALARFSADEFVILRVGLSESTPKESLADEILASFATPFAYGEHEFYLTASVGSSFAPDDAGDAERLVAQAEAAMFEAKRLGRNTAHRYVPSMLATPIQRHVLQRELLHAVEREQLELVYQPVYDVVSGTIVSVEALVRWRHPTLGLIVPDRFIPMAEESGLIDAIGEWVIARVCEQVRAWVDAGIPKVRVSLNVSARQLERFGFQQYIGDAIARNGIEPVTIQIEVTETSILRDVYAATLILRDLRAMGLRVAIDDFGTGYTSLAFLRDLPIDDLKIDRSFVRDVATGAFDGAVVSAVITLARSLGVRTVAEGVEDAAQMNVLRELRCDAVQGFFFSMPLSAADCTSLLQAIPA